MIMAIMASIEAMAPKIMVPVVSKAGSSLVDVEMGLRGERKEEERSVKLAWIGDMFVVCG